MTSKPTAEEVVRALRCWGCCKATPICATCEYRPTEQLPGMKSTMNSAADLLESTLARNAEMEKQLTETQRQLRAAVGSLAKIDALCVAFRDTGASGLADMFARDVVEISGPDAVEGEQ